MASKLVSDGLHWSDISEGQTEAERVLAEYLRLHPLATGEVRSGLSQVAQCARDPEFQPAWALAALGLHQNKKLD